MTAVAKNSLVQDAVWNNDEYIDEDIVKTNGLILPNMPDIEQIDIVVDETKLIPNSCPNAVGLRSEIDTNNPSNALASYPIPPEAAPELENHDNFQSESFDKILDELLNCGVLDRVMDGENPFELPSTASGNKTAWVLFLWMLIESDLKLRNSEPLD